MFLTTIKSAWRQLWYNKAYSAITVLGIAFGLAVAILCGLWVQQQLAYDSFHANGSRIYQAMQNYVPTAGPIETDNSVPMPLADVLREETTGVKHVALTDWPQTLSLVNADKKLLKEGNYVEPDFLKVFTFEMLDGNVEQALQSPNEIVLSASTAKALFGDEPALGQMLSVEEEVNVQVVGVFADWPTTSTFQFDFLLPFSLRFQQWPWIEKDRTNWESFSYQIFFQLEERVAVDRMVTQHHDLFVSKSPETSSYFQVHALPDWHLYNVFEDGQPTTGRIRFVWLFSVIGGLVLLIALMNFINLTTARAERRSKEIGVRKTIGALRHNLITQFMVEVGVANLIAFMLAFGLVIALLPTFSLLVEETIVFPWSQLWFWGLCLILWVLSTLVAGSYPAFVLTQHSAKAALLQGNRANGRATVWGRRALVTTQFMVSIALIAGSLVVYEQVQYGQDRDPGYSADRLIEVPLNMALARQFSTLKERLQANPAVAGVSRTSGKITEISSTSSDFVWPGKTAEETADFAFVGVGPDYFTTTGMQLQAGRSFQAQDQADELAIVLNEAAVRQMQLTDPLATQLHWGDDQLQIVGVVKDAVMETPFEPAHPTVFLKRDWLGAVLVRLADDYTPAAALAQVSEIVSMQDPARPFTYSFVADNYADKFKEARFIGTVTLVFAGMAILLSALGLLGLAMYLTERRAKEMSIRKILGASAQQIWTLLSKEFVGVILLGSVLAVPLGSYWLNDWLSQYSYRIALPWYVFILAAGLALFIALATISIQSIQLVLANPVERLRDE